MGLNKLGKQSQTQTSVEWDPIWMSKHWALGAVRMPALSLFPFNTFTEHCSRPHAVLGMRGRGEEQDRRVCVEDAWKAAWPQTINKGTRSFQKVTGTVKEI